MPGAAVKGAYFLYVRLSLGISRLQHPCEAVAVPRKLPREHAIFYYKSSSGFIHTSKYPKPPMLVAFI
jgi:hypothetical protein